jgi:hypothetical protein
MKMSIDTESQGSEPMSVEECIARLESMRARLWPLLEATRNEYRTRVRNGYPRLVDNVARGGVFGLDFDPGFGVYFMTDGESVYAELHYIALRTDTLSAANREKFAGEPELTRYHIDADWSDLQLRNIVSELVSRWNWQQTVIYRVDS